MFLPEARFVVGNRLPKRWQSNSRFLITAAAASHAICPQSVALWFYLLDLCEFDKISQARKPSFECPNVAFITGVLAAKFTWLANST